ncbi:MAG TPA: hypothetical protein H9740_05130 [Candidatus Hungatella pullicola]|nr:hypothetical protein [Candidatus Hungatella pullicola]
MKDYKALLEQAQENIIKGKQLESRKEKLHSQLRDLEEKAEELRKIKYKEERDVEQLERFSLSALFAKLTGTLDERTEKEKSEAYAASVKYVAAMGEAELVREDLRRTSEALSVLGNYERKYHQILEEKKRELTECETEEGRRILELEQQKADYKGQLKEIDEAISAGNSAMGGIARIEESLKSAKNWSTWDMVGGGMASDMMKHSRLNEAQRQAEELQRQLRKFKIELADIQVDCELQLQIEGFLKFADFFFDGIFVDWTVHSKIENSAQEVQTVKNQVEKVLHFLENKRIEKREQIDEAERQLNQIVYSA